jgi:hypothetical protein
MARATYAAIRGPHCIRRHPTGQRKPTTRVAKCSTVPPHPPADQCLTIAQINDHLSYITLPGLPLRGHRSGRFRVRVDLLRVRGWAWTWAWACAPGEAPAAPQKQRPHHPRAKHNQRRSNIEPLIDREENTILHLAPTRLNGTSFNSPSQQRARRRLQPRNAPSAGASAAPPHNDPTRMLAAHAPPPSTTPRAARTTRWCRRRRHNGPARPARGVAGEPAESALANHRRGHPNR